MKTPICDFVREYAESKSLRLHMPGHKGKGEIGCEAFDITEISGADVLYSADGIIKESQLNAAELFGTAGTFYSTEGSSLAIRAMLYLAATHGGKAPIIAAARNVHKTFVTGCALLGIDVDWLYPENKSSLLSCSITPTQLDRYLVTHDPIAVYITSPDYLGNISDITALAEVCHRHGTLLLVDNAHGAYLNFLHESRHPIALGADICCDSAHKTLPVLTGGAYLHISKNAPAELYGQAMNALSMFASTSPSYLILQSLDRVNKYLSDGYKEILNDFVKQVRDLKKFLSAIGYKLTGDEELKLTVEAKTFGYSGEALGKLLSENGIICEFSDPDYLVLMLTPEIGIKGLAQIKKAFENIPIREPIHLSPPLPLNAEKRMTPRQAMLSQSVEINIEDSLGRVLAAANVSCPPAIPILISGEVIDERAIECFKYYGIDKCRVVENK